MLGGTGFLGPHLVEAALASGWEITLFNRGKTNPHLFPGLEKLRGDRDGDLGALEGRRWRAVVDTSGYVPRIVKMSSELLGPSIEQYMFVSSVSVYADFSQIGIDETAPVATMEDPANEEVLKNYGALKALCEQAAEEAMPGRVTNLRPGLIVGPGDPSDRFTYWPVRIARGGRVLCPGTPDDRVQFIDARDLAAWMVGALDNRHVGVYNAVGPDQPLSIGELLHACMLASDSDAQLVWANAEFLEEQEVTPWRDMPVWVPSSAPDSRGFATVRSDRAKKTGLRFGPVEQTVADTLAWWNALPAERREKLRAGLPPEREREVLAAWQSRREHEEAGGSTPTSSAA